NHFNLRPSYFSEGEGNYRDVNQNRRMDLFFEPSLGYRNILYFLNFLKIDGYNPLVVTGEKLYLSKAQAENILKEFGIKNSKVLHLMVKGFYLGDFFNLLAEEAIEPDSKQELAASLLTKAQRRPQSYHAEGYWIDHWRYNLDLIENFLYIYPDKLKDVFLDNNFMFWDDEHRVKPRALRYVLRAKAVYQGESIEAVKEKKLSIKKRDKLANFLRAKGGKIYKTNLIVKLLAVILNKAATLDPHGIGIEMEADKPGWCDSLNGLPALFGSSLCETFELKRACLLLQSVIKELKKKNVKSVLIAQEIFLFFKQLDSLLEVYFSSSAGKRDYLWWDKSNLAKEEFRAHTSFFLKGLDKRLDFNKLDRFLGKLIKKIDLGIKKAKDAKSGLPFTYFTYEVTKYQHKNKHIVPLEFKRRPLALSLEGVVGAMRVEKSISIHKKIKKSPLFDSKLKMYRLNASLAKESLEIGRSRVFVPGWLENESIWLHMEYKYILELLKNGFYEDFFKAMDECCVCFFKPEEYGRSTLENSSFVVSSAYPDKKIWGKGFVARLSGATAEFLNIWALMCLGREPFFMDKNNNLRLRFAPILKKDFFTSLPRNVKFNGKSIKIEKNTFTFKLFSKTLVCYHNNLRKDTFKGCRVKKIEVALKGKKDLCFSSILSPSLSSAVRRGEAEKIDVYLG
ncbi:MAG: hypothetical protein WCY34_05530, partial [Candidatus Omnitrophota bacterium]